ncbi:hypothetical protein BpHYR1_011396, partial [Brachionus plicatilis]
FGSDSFKLNLANLTGKQRTSKPSKPYAWTVWTYLLTWRSAFDFFVKYNHVVRGTDKYISN